MSAGMQLIKKLCNCTMLSIFLIICGCSKKDPGVFHEDFKDKVLNELKASGYSLKGRDITARKQNEIPGYILANPHMKRANESVMTSAEPNFTERFLFKVGNNYILMDFYTINGKTCYVVVHAPESPDNVIGENESYHQEVFRQYQNRFKEDNP
jgi:hypothetical protein